MIVSGEVSKVSRAWGLGAYVPFLASLRNIICFCRHNGLLVFRKTLSQHLNLVTCSDGEYERHLGSFQQNIMTLSHFQIPSESRCDFLKGSKKGVQQIEHAQDFSSPA